jgi:hypothetical protein
MGNKNVNGIARKLNDIEIATIIENTSFTRDEILQWHKGFVVSETSKWIKNNNNTHLLLKRKTFLFF